MKRFSAAICLLLFVVLLGGLPRPVTEAQDSVPAGWTGITDRAGLEQISSAPDGKYILMNDIDLSAAPWQSLCSEDAPFTGSLDGNGHTIYGMTVSDSQNACGLFSYLCGGTVESLTVSGSASGPIAGLLAGKISRGTVRDCTVQGSVTSSFFGGGIAGQISGSSVTVLGCSSAAVVSGNGSEAGELNLGGICGAVYGTGQVLSECAFTGELKPAGAVLNAGGIAGLLEGGTDGVLTVFAGRCDGALSLSYTDSACVGGVVGRIGGGTVTLSKCVFEGDWQDPSCRGVLSLGGIAGRGEATGQILLTQCTALGSLTGTGHPDFTSSDGYRCTACAASLGTVGSVNSGTVVVQNDLDVQYSALVGGILGAGIAQGGTIRVSQCASSVFLTGAGSPVMLGGIAGLNRSDTGTALIEDCFSAGRITDPSPIHGEIASARGGIVGFHGGGGTAILRRCFSACESDVDYPLSDGAVAGLVSCYYGDGYDEESASVSVSDCYVLSGLRDRYGVSLSGEGMSDLASYPGFDFSEVWQINPVSGMPNPKNAPISVSSTPIGDVDGNGRITRYDGVLLTRYLTGNAPLTPAQIWRADYNGDGTVNARDAALILRNAS